MASKPRQRRYKGGSPAKPKRPFSERNGVLMTYEEAADELGVLEAMVKKVVARGQLKSVKVGSLNRIHRDDLNAYIAQLRGEAQ
jgi:excisionase family DNA binding protein